jgi:glycosyltransferase involved in cell wall biosynthesis
MSVLVTIAMATRNAERFIGEALASVPLALEGADADYEIVLADGCSEDKTLEIAARDPKLRLVSRSDSGLYDGMNRAIASATGEFVLILNSDDMLLPLVVPQAVAALGRDPSADFASGGVLSGSSITGTVCRRHRSPLTAEGVLFGVPAINARLFRAPFLRRLGPIRTDIGFGADREYLLRAIRVGGRGMSIDRPLYFYRGHEGSQTMSNDRAGRLRVYRSDLQLARALLEGDVLSSEHAKLVRAFMALAILKLRLSGAHDETVAAPSAHERLGPRDLARGLWLRCRWRGVLSGY